jgi:predicted nucleotidyltransferase
MARGDYKPESDLDIGVIIPPVRGKSSLHVSEYYHRRFSSDSEKPHFGGRVVDFQFFYPGEIEYLIVHNGYTTIKVE